MSAITSCGKCHHPRDTQNRVILKRHSVCDLSPASGYSGPCAIKQENGEIDLDDGDGGHAVAKPKKDRKKDKERRNASHD